MIQMRPHKKKDVYHQGFFEILDEGSPIFLFLSQISGVQNALLF